MQVVLYTLGGLGAALLLVLALVGVRYLTRGTPVASVSGVEHNHELPQTDDKLFQSSIALLTGTSFSDANHAELCLNGDGTYPRLFADIANAT